MENYIEKLGIKELFNLYKNKSLSPVEVIKNQFNRIEMNKDINAFITVTEDLAMITAKESEERYMKGEPLGVMDGVPYAVKDNIFTKGIKTTMASEIYKDYYPDINATVIDKLNGSGAILLGKTNTHEFASGATCDRTYFGPIKNPHNKKKMPGGSSGGSAAALAANLCPAALGSDTSGSVRIPASACGVVGMKPTQGRVSKYGVYPLSDTIDHVGPMTRTVEDNAILLRVIAGYDSLDPWSLKLPNMDYSTEIGQSVKGMVVGIPYSIFKDNTDPLIYDSVVASIEILKSLGAKIIEIPNPDPDGTFVGACRAVRISEGYAVHEKNIMEKHGLYNPEILQQMLVGKDFKAYEYINGLQMRNKFKTHFKEMMNDIDIMIMPTMPLLPPDINQREVEIRGIVHSVFTRFNLFTIIASFTGFPSISIPCGITEDNLPIGLQILTNEYEEAKAYRFAYQIEKALDLKL